MSKHTPARPTFVAIMGKVYVTLVLALSVPRLELANQNNRGISHVSNMSPSVMDRVKNNPRRGAVTTSSLSTIWGILSRRNPGLDQSKRVEICMILRSNPADD